MKGLENLYEPKYFLDRPGAKKEIMEKHRIDFAFECLIYRLQVPALPLSELRNKIKKRNVLRLLRVS